MLWKRNRQELRPDPGDESLVWAPSMIPQASKVADEGPEGLDATAYGGVQYIDTVVGRGLQFKRVRGQYVKSDALDTRLSPADQDFTLMVWARIRDDSAAGYLVTRGTQVAILSVPGYIRFYYDDNNGHVHVVDHLGNFVDDMWHLLVMTYDSSTGVMTAYIDGVVSGTDTYSPANGANKGSQNLVLGASPAGTFPADCQMVSPAIYSEVKSAGWVGVIFKTGLRSVRYRQGGWSYIPTEVHTGPKWIQGTPLYLASGQANVEIDTILGIETKVIKAGSAAATIYINPDGLLNGVLGPPKEAGYGEWKFWHYQDSAATTRIDMAGQVFARPAVQLFNNTTARFFQHFVGGTINEFAAGSNPLGWSEWRIRIERRITFTGSQIRGTVWRDNILLSDMVQGSNPTAWYLVDYIANPLRLTLGFNNIIALSSEDGRRSLRKHAMWEAA